MPVISKSGSVAEASRAPKMTSRADFFQAAPRVCATFPVPRMAIFMDISFRDGRARRGAGAAAPVCPRRATMDI